MPIIIDNFFVNTNAPIDNRFVVGPGLFYLTKDDINYKYVGLRVWDSNNSVPYYWDGTQWLSENSIGVLADTSPTLGGLPNYIAKFTDGATTVGKSIIFENPASNQIGIGLVGTAIEANIPSGPSLVNGLHVAGNIRTNASFVGSGLYVTDINATNINNGLLTVNRIAHFNITSLAPNIEYVLFNEGITNSVRWRAASGLSVLNSTNTTNVNISEENSSSSSHYITFVNNTSGQLPLRINSSKMQFKPNNGQLLLSDGSTSAPVYSFLSGGSNTGFYYSYSGNGNAVPSTIGGIGTSINGVEITRTNQNGLVVNNRIYISPTTDNLTNVGHGIVWLLGGATNDTTINDGFPYNGQRLNYYGIGSHIPTDSTISGGRGTYISGYFGVDIFSGSSGPGTGRLKIKVHETNDVTINSRLNINNIETLQSSVGSNVVLSTMQNSGGTLGSFVVVKDWSVRASQALTPYTAPNDSGSWLTWKHHNGITVDNVWATPNGPDNGQVTASGTLTFWERHPYIHEQYFGSVNRKTLTINSSTSPFVKVNGNIYNVTGNPFIGTYSVVSTKTLEDVLNNNLPKTIKTGMFDVYGTSMYSTVPNSNGKFQIITVNDNDFANYLKWIEIPYNASELNNVVPGQTSYIGTSGSIEPLDNYYNTHALTGVTSVTGRARYDTYGTRNSFQQGWHNIKGYKVFQINQRGDDDSRFKVLMYKDPAYIADFNSGKLTEWKLEKNATGVSVAYGGIGNGGRYDFLMICPSWRPIPTYFMNQPGMSHVEIYIHEPAGEFQDMALYINLQRRNVLVPTTLNTNLPGIPLGSYTGI